MTMYPLLTPEERRRLIEAPIRIRTIGGSRHGGTGVASDDGLHRTYTPKRLVDDESYLQSGANKDGE
jgi:hypothetical protein